MGDEVITHIDPPKSREQLALLLMRWNALKRKGVSPNANHPEMLHLTKMLRDIAQQQRDFEHRKDAVKRDRVSATPGSSSNLQAQLAAYKLLIRGMPLPKHLQDALFQYASESEKAEVLNLHKVALQKHLDRPISVLHSRLDKEVEELLGTEAPVNERLVRNQLANRVIELERLSGNLGTIKADSAELTPPDELLPGADDLKFKALIELKGLRLLTKQKSLRQHVVFNTAATSEQSRLSQSLIARCMNWRIKNTTEQELEMTQELQSQQSSEREQQARHSQIELTKAAVKKAFDFGQNIEQHRQRKVVFQKHILQFHGQIEREESKRAERTAKQRLQALRSNDEEAYLKLLDQTKDTRLTHLIKQTNQFLASLSEAVRVQQSEAGAAPAPPTEEELENIDYYEVAHRVKETVTEQASILVGGKLKEYQIKGLQWMISLVNNNLNGILADEMGLGKTIQTISLITYLIEKKKWPGPFLVIVPLSTITNWTVEFDKWAPAVKTVVYKGPPNARKAQQAIIRSGDFQVLLTTYEYVIKDRPLLSKIRWQHMIIDEGHRMKNSQSKLSSTLVNHYYSKHRLILTGTPLQNNLPELWALLNFVLPKIFNSQKTFDEWFNTPFANTGGQDKMELTEEEMLLVIRRLHKVLRPFLLRRLKKDVEKDLPDKVEKVIKCKTSSLQQSLYEQILKFGAIYTGDGVAGSENNKRASGMRSLNNRIMQLRKICNHPFVFPEVEQLVDPTTLQYNLLWRTAGKFELLDRILPKFKSTGHRVLIFFQMTQIMDIMEDYLRFKGMQYMRLDGSTKADERSDKLKLFNAEDSPYFCFLLSTRAGGLGLNLQTADTVIIYDTDWNPFQDLQAQDRAHRIGQTKEVRILRLITEHTVEEAILDRAVSKLEIDGKVIQAGKFDNKSTNEEQEEFLRKLMEAEEMRRDNKDQEEEEMDDDELNSILARGDSEMVKFRELDEERVEEERRSGVPRLYSQAELPDLYKEDLSKKFAAPVYAELGSRRERRGKVVFDDNLSEDEWLRQQEIDDDEELGNPEEDEEEFSAPRSANKSATATPEPAGDGVAKPEVGDSSLISASGEPKRRRGRPRKEKRTEETNGSTPSKRVKVELTPEQYEHIKTKAAELFDVFNAQTADEPPRSRSAVFLELPSRKDFPDYYQVIQTPVSLAEIEKRVENSEYATFAEVKADFQQMLNNATTYNLQGSLIWVDADYLKGVVNDFE